MFAHDISVPFEWCYSWHNHVPFRSHVSGEGVRGRREEGVFALCTYALRVDVVVPFVPACDDGRLNFRLFSHSLARSLAALTPTRNRNHLSTLPPSLSNPQ